MTAAKANKAKKSRLGRGLSALFEEAELAYGGAANALDSAATSPASVPATWAEISGGVGVLSVTQLAPGPFQPRRDFDADGLEELAASIRHRGVIQAIIVRPHPTEHAQYQIIAGERRWRAAQMAQLHEVPVIIREMEDAVAMEVSLVENLQRRDLNPLEEAEGYKRLMEDYAHTQDEMAKAVGKSRSHISNMLRLLHLPEAVRRLVAGGQLSFGHARALMALPARAAEAAALVIKKGLNVRQTEALIRRLKSDGAGASDTAKSAAREEKDTDTLALEKSLSAHLGLAAHIDHKKGGEKGQLKISYQSLDQLDDLMQKLMR